MPLDDIGEVAIRFGGRILGRIFVEIIFELICYFLGKTFLFVITFGTHKNRKTKYEDGTFESTIGVCLLIVGFIIYAVVKN